jgi:hypothetical protein
VTKKTCFGVNEVLTFPPPYELQVAQSAQSSQLPFAEWRANLRLEDQIGYEVVPHKGPTTNFVGDAMTMV